MRSYGPRFDPDGVVQHARVAQAATYDLATILWRRRVAGGELRCELLRVTGGTGRRIVRLVADYEEGDTSCTRTRVCDTPLEEELGAIYLERVMLEASRRGAPSAPAPAPSAP